MDIKKELQDAQALQDSYKAFNKALRTAKAVTADDVRAVGKAEGVDPVTVEDALYNLRMYQRARVPAFKLTNNNARIKRLRSKLQRADD